jgi:hypothetical protein
LTFDPAHNDRLKRIDELLNKGCKFNFVIIEPCTEASRIMFDNVREVKSLKHFNENVVQTMGLLLDLKKKYPDKLFVVLNDHVPAFKIMAMYRKDFEYPKYIQVFFYSEKIPYTERLGLGITRSKRNKVYEYFYKQIDALKTRLPPERGLTIDELKNKIESAREQIKVSYTV